MNQALDSFDQNTSQSRSVPFAFHIKLGKRTLCSAAKMTALPCYPQYDISSSAPDKQEQV